MQVTTVIPTYNAGDRLIETVSSILSEERIDHKIIIFTHSDDPKTIEACADMPENVIIHDYRENRGLSRSWNDGIIEGYDGGADVVMLVNDDITFNHGDFFTIVSAAIEHRECFIVSCGGTDVASGNKVNSFGYACVALNPIALEKVGYFDENLKPAYFEDCDYAVRAQRAGVVEFNCPGTNIIHVGSATARFSSPDILGKIRRGFSRNMAYYHLKWGGWDGAPQKEQYDHPFNDPLLSIVITRDERSNPYESKLR